MSIPQPKNITIIVALLLIAVATFAIPKGRALGDIGVGAPGVLGGPDAEQVAIQVRIREKTEFGEFSDALYYSPDEWRALSQTDLDKQIQQRVDAWIAVVKPSSNPEATENSIPTETPAEDPIETPITSDIPSDVVTPTATPSDTPTPTPSDTPPPDEVTPELISVVTSSSSDAATPLPIPAE